MTGFFRWRSAERAFDPWQRSGVLLDVTGALRLDPASAAREHDSYAPGTYNGHNFYNGSSYRVGEALSPETVTPFAFTEAIASWNAGTPDGAWIETLIRAQVGRRWTKWYSLGVWASGAGTVERHSVGQQADADGDVNTDTLVLTNKQTPADAFQVKIRLFSADGEAIPTLRGVSVAYFTTPSENAVPAPGNPKHWNCLLDVPRCSQMVYPDGGEVWCSPTSTAMVLGYWRYMSGPCKPGVHDAVEGVYDWQYDGHGNWPFNTAYAATHGMEAYVARFGSLAQAEEWVAASIPVIVSFAWGKDDLTGAPIPSSNGHLAVLVGFDAAGNPIINDPAAADDEDVQRTYLRSEFEPLWLKHSGGTVYLVFPKGHATPRL